MGAFAAGPMQTAIKAAANLPQTGTLDLFAVVGTVRARIWSRVTTTLGASGGSVVKYLFTPTVGASASDLSTAADLGTAAATVFVFPFTATGNTFLSSGGGAVTDAGSRRPMGANVPGLWFAAGTFQINATGNQTGQLEHFCFWVPMTPDSYVYSL